jgi:hypothetical protein
MDKVYRILFNNSNSYRTIIIRIIINPIKTIKWANRGKTIIIIKIKFYKEFLKTKIKFSKCLFVESVKQMLFMKLGRANSFSAVNAVLLTKPLMKKTKLMKCI